MVYTKEEVQQIIKGKGEDCDCEENFDSMTQLSNYSPQNRKSYGLQIIHSWTLGFSLLPLYYVSPYSLVAYLQLQSTFTH